MTPAEHVVIQRATALAAGSGTLADLVQAVAVLEDERKSRPAEMPLTYGRVVAGDEIQATNGRWFEVARTAAGMDQTSVRVWLKKVAAPLEKFAGQEVMVRRGELGLAADVLASVVWSGDQPRRPAA